MGVTEWQRHSRRVTRGPRWKTLRMAVLERDGFKCRFCGKNRGRLEIGARADAIRVTRIGAAGAVRGSQADRNNQQRYRDSQGRYYYCYDNRQDECYWDNGQRRY